MKRPHLAKRCRRWRPLVVVVSGAIALAACSGPGFPTVARLGPRSDRGGSSRDTTTALSTGNATQVLDSWAVCMRSHGDPDQADPFIDANNVVHVTYPAGYSSKDGEGGSGASHACNAYLTAASTALGGQPSEQDPTKMLAFSQCMRAHGVPDFPDPTDVDGIYHFPLGIHPESSNSAVAVPGPSAGSDLNPSNPTNRSAAKRCAQKVGVPRWGLNPGSAPGSVVVSADG